MATLDDLKAALADRYEIQRELGVGGMATVYLARDLKHDRLVALKVLKPELQLGGDRFLREITIAAHLQHPHILPLFDSGESAGLLWYVMPYVEGESLREKLDREGELPIVEATKILREVTDALAKAHSAGVVHRDIKPDNVMLADGHAIVMDFGVAKAVSESTGRQGVTTAGVALGTPAYMAPEQAAADPHIDHRADLYAAGAMAYEMLCGRPPFVAPTPQAVLAAHVTEVPDDVTRSRETAPPQLSALIMRCLEKKPADRWQSADEMLRQLEVVHTPTGGMTPTGMRPVDSGAEVALGNLERADSLMAEGLKLYPDNPTVLRVQGDLLWSSGRYAAAEQAWTDLAQRNIEGWPFSRWNLASAAMHQGRFERFNRGMGEAVASAPLGVRPMLRIFTLAGQAQLAVQLGLESGELVALEAAVRSSAFKAIPSAFNPYEGVVTAFARAGRVNLATELQAEYLTEVDSVIRANEQPSAVHSMTAEIAMAESRYADALEAYRLARSRDACPTCYVLELANAFDKSGSVDSAMVYYERFLTARLPNRVGQDGFYRHATLRRLGELYDEAGDTERALEYYGDFADLWAEADPVLQPQVEEVRQRMAELAGEGN